MWKINQNKKLKKNNHWLAYNTPCIELHNLVKHPVDLPRIVHGLRFHPSFPDSPWKQVSPCQFSARKDLRYMLQVFQDLVSQLGCWSVGQIIPLHMYDQQIWSLSRKCQFPNCQDQMPPLHILHRPNQSIEVESLRTDCPSREESATLHPAPNTMLCPNIQTLCRQFPRQNKITNTLGVKESHARAAWQKMNIGPKSTGPPPAQSLSCTLPKT